MSRSLQTINNTDLALKVVLFLAVAVAAAGLIYQLRVLIVCLLLAITMASAMTPIVESAEKKKIPRLATALLLYLAAAIAYGALAAMLAPAVHEQWHKLIGNLPGYLSGLNNWYQSVIDHSGYNSGALTFNIEDVRNLSFRVLRQTLDMTAGFLGLILNGILTLFLATYFVVEADKIWAGILRWMPRQLRARLAPLIAPLALRMGGYARGQLFVALGVAVFLAVGFSLVGLKYSLVLGILAGLLNLVPYVGSLIACIFAVIVAFNQTPILAVAVLLIYGLEQWIESAFMVPFFLGKCASLHPLIVLIAIIVGASLMGVAGAIVSVPVASAAMFLAEEFYLKRLECPQNDVSDNSKEKANDKA